MSATASKDRGHRQHLPWRLPHLSSRTWRALAFWTGVALVILVVIAELVWMGQRVRDHRALRATQNAPPKVFSLPLTGFKP